MRPIEFRGFSLSDNQWKYGYYYVNTLDMHNIVCPDGMTYEVDPASIGQYTGLKDKNGVKIYEGDLTIMEDFFSNEEVVSICWYKSGAWGLGDYEIFIHELVPEIEIIGNTYEHPNLLQQ